MWASRLPNSVRISLPDGVHHSHRWEFFIHDRRNPTILIIYVRIWKYSIAFFGRMYIKWGFWLLFRVETKLTILYDKVHAEFPKWKTGEPNLG